jgi:hypothetical protein
MAIKRFYRRRFLNLRGHHAGAYVIADCSVATWDDNARIDADLSVADCNRVVTLDFGFAVGNTAEARNALHKAHALLTVLQEFVEALEAAQQDAMSARS